MISTDAKDVWGVYVGATLFDSVCVKVYNHKHIACREAGRLHKSSGQRPYVLMSTNKYMMRNGWIEVNGKWSKVNTEVTQR